MTRILGNIINKLRLQGVSCVEIAPGPSPYKIAAYVRGAKVNEFSLVTDIWLSIFNMWGCCSIVSFI